MYGSSILLKAKQHFIQFGVKTPINISNAVCRFAKEGVPEDEAMVIYKGHFPTFEISSIREFNRCAAINGDSDYRVGNENILFETADMNRIVGVVDAMNKYHTHRSYLVLIDELVSIMEPKPILSHKQFDK